MSLSHPSLLSLSQKITTTSSLLLERSRVLSLNLPPSASSQTQIVRNLTAIKKELDRLESTSLADGVQRKKGKEGDLDRQLREAGEIYDRLLDKFAEDDVGREKSKSLRREVPKPAATAQPDLPLISTSNNTFNGGIPNVKIEPPTPANARHSDLPFKDFPDDNGPLPEEVDERDDREILSSQQLMMDDQDERLNLLSNSIGRQQHLSIQIGSELDHHHELLEDVDGALDRTSTRLTSARRRLDKVAHDAKQHGSTITIVALILILLLLIIVFKT